MADIENFTFDELQLGQSATLQRRLTLNELRMFAGDASQLNPGHMDEAFASSDLYQGLVAHAMWGQALISTLVGTELPGPGTVFVSQSLRYGGPIQMGESVTVRVEVKEKHPDSGEVVLACSCTTDNGDEALAGDVVVQPPRDKLRRPMTHGAAAGQNGRHRQLQRLQALAADIEPALTAVVHPVDELSLQGALQAAEQGLIIPVLVGPEAKIRAAAEKAGVDLHGVRLVPTEHSHAAAAEAVRLASRGEVEALMKGALHTDELMGAVLNRDAGLRTDRRMSHVWVVDLPTYPRPLLITDGAINIAPNLETKRDIIQNAIDLAHALGIEQPRVAILSATESVNVAIPSTLDAAALCKMADRGQIRGGLLDGPLAFDNAISEAAARTKGIASEVAGRADILMAPNLESSNMIGKQLYYLADAESAGIVLGARVPIVLTSRAEGTAARLGSCAVALLLVHQQRQRSHAQPEPRP